MSRGLRLALVATARRMVELGLSRGTSGNVSVRVGDGFLVTPSAVPYDRMGPEDAVHVGADGRSTGSRRRPSSEWRMHRDVLAARHEVGAVLHAHPPFATSLACLRRAIPPFHYMVAALGGTDVRCAPYARYGTQELSDLAVAALTGRQGCLLANHGILAVGADLDAALATAVEIEALAEMYARALQVGEPVLLSDAEMADVLAAFADYGGPRDLRR